LLEALNGLELLVNVVSLGLEGFKVLLDFIDDRGVLQDGAVMAEIDGCGLIGQNLDSTTGIVMSLLEVGERGRCAASKAELCANFAPVELRCRACL
jgi:hypothetical protein